jgi:hypothetical protein
MLRWFLTVAMAAAGSQAAVERQQLRIEPWGQNSIRVRAAPAGRGVNLEAPGALIAMGRSPVIKCQPPPAPAHRHIRLQV